MANPPKPERSLSLLYPPFKEILLAALDEAHDDSIPAYIFESYRFKERQNFLYAQGRTEPGKIITNAQAGESWHQYGVAVDIAFDADPSTPGVQWTWEGAYADDNEDLYSRLAKILKGHGLEWLGDKNIERAHFQKSWGFSIKEAREITEARGVLGFWQILDTKL